MATERERQGRDNLGVWDEHVHCTVNKIDNQKGFTVQHRELYSIFCNNLSEKRMRKTICRCITESLGYPPETNTNYKSSILQ